MIMACPACKVAIQCTGYRKEMDGMVDLIVCGEENDKAIIEDFQKLQGAQEMLWKEFTMKHYGF